MNDEHLVFLTRNPFTGFLPQNQFGFVHPATGLLARKKAEENCATSVDAGCIAQLVRDSGIILWLKKLNGADSRRVLLHSLGGVSFLLRMLFLRLGYAP